MLYDGGANIGITSLIAAEDDIRNVLVVAIEPAPANYLSLVKNIALNGYGDRVFALPIGLGASTDIACFNLTTLEPGGVMHSFGEILVTNLDKLRMPIAFHHCLRLKLDDLVNWNGLPFPWHIKIDVDGGEFDLLQGASRVLNDLRCCAAQIEVVARYDHNQNFPRVSDFQFARL